MQLLLDLLTTSLKLVLFEKGKRQNLERVQNRKNVTNEKFRLHACQGYSWEQILVTAAIAKKRKQKIYDYMRKTSVVASTSKTAVHGFWSLYKVLVISSCMPLR